MPVALTYPGVYVEEIPSGVRTIVGVPTSITAFVGRAARGSVDEPIVINNFGDFERSFGGLNVNYPMSYAVADYFRNGGGQALVVRLFSPSPTEQETEKQQVQEAADAVVAATVGATATDAAVAARAKANGYTQEPAKSAADGVAKAAEAKAGEAGATVAAVAAAATAAATAAKNKPPENTVARLVIERDVAAAIDAVVDAVVGAAKPSNGTAPTIKELTDAAATAEGKFTKEPGKTAAMAVKQSVVDAAAVVDATIDSVMKAAKESVNKATTSALDKPEANPLRLKATHGGAWGNRLRARVDHSVASDLAWLAPNNLTSGDLFNLTVHDAATGSTETHLNVTVKESPRQIGRVLQNFSQLVRLDAAPAAAATARPAAHGDLKDGARNVWTDPKLSSEVSTEATNGNDLEPADYLGNRPNKTGIYALEKADIFNILCIPPDTRNGDVPDGVLTDALAYCVERRAMLIVDPPTAWTDFQKAADEFRANGVHGLAGTDTRNAAVYFPRVLETDSQRNGALEAFPACGLVAGAYARTDVQRGVWKAPAGIEVSLNGARGLGMDSTKPMNLTDEENGVLNPLGINCLRRFPVIGPVIWGARTLRGADILADEYKYVPVRRLVLYIEESLYRGTQWVVFEPNDAPLWAQIRLNVGAFMHNLFRQGAFQGSTPRDAYLVKCDSETTTQNDINLGIVNIVVGFAPLKPAEFVVLKIQQLAGQIEA